MKCNTGNEPAEKGVRRVRKRLTPVVLFTLDPGIEGGAIGSGVEQIIRIKGLCGFFNVLVGTGILAERPDQGPIVYPGDPGNMKVCPVIINPGFRDLVLQPLRTLPPNIPYAYNIGAGNFGIMGGLPSGGETSNVMADALDVTITIDAGSYEGTLLEGRLIVSAIVEWVGCCNDKMIDAFMSEVNMTGNIEPIVIGTGVNG